MSPSKEVALDLAAFLDSDEARALTAPDAKAVRRIAEAFLTVAYDEIGSHPRLFDGEAMHGALGHLLPGHFKRKDPLAEHVPAVLRAYLAHLEASAVVPQSFEMRRAFEETLGEFLETVRTGHNAHHHHHAPKQKPVVHKAPKLGRNDPCFCGSGKKFKKCCGKQE